MLQNVTSTVKILFWINVVLFLMTYFGGMVGIPFLDYGALFPISSPNFHVYQFITSMFLHGGWLHIIFNMMALISIGPDVETQLGERKFLLFYILMGLGAAIAQLSFTSGAMIGASGAIFGLLIFFAFYNPDAEMMIFPFPIKIKVKYLTAILLSIEIGSIIFRLGAGIGHFAHLGGALTGLILYKLDQKFNFNI